MPASAPLIGETDAPKEDRERFEMGWGPPENGVGSALK